MIFLKKTILLTIFFGAVLAIVIFHFFYHEDLNIVTLGDHFSLGYTAYDVKGYSYNDYLRDYFEEESIIKEYITEFAYPEETTQTLLLKLENNYILEETSLSLTQAIAKAKILTISIGMYELNHKEHIEREEIEEYLKNMNKILNLIRINNRKEIFLTSLYETNKLSKANIKELNESLKELASKYQIHYIDITDVPSHKEYYFNNTSYLINYQGHKYIKEKILDQLE